MPTNPKARSFLSHFRRLPKDERGTSAIEFALILPIMIVLYFGSVEVNQSVSTNRKLSSVASSLGDLAAQSANLSDQEISDIFDAATAIIAPFETTPLQMVLTGVQVDNNGVARVEWSEGYGRAGYGKGSTFDLPDRLKRPNTFHVVSEADYTYTPIFNEFVSGPFTLSETFYLRPRRSNAISRS